MVVSPASSFRSPPKFRSNWLHGDRARRIDLARGGRANAQLAGQHGRSSVDRFAAGTRDLDAHVDRNRRTDDGHDPRRRRRSRRPAGRADGNRLGSRYLASPGPQRGQRSCRWPRRSAKPSDRSAPRSATAVLRPKSLGPASEDNGLPGGGGGGNSLELRLNGPGRAAMVRSGGGTPESEKAVALALEWLAEHQNYDGSWSFDHGKNPRCHGRCANEGSNASKIAATSLALLPFLGTGQTHREGHYKRNIDLGLKYLVRTIEAQRDGSLWDPAGTMYAHGLASIVLCEAYGMTHDQVLEEPAQAAVNFIVFAQDPLGGGWRYQPQTPGDTSVVGWQLMALEERRRWPTCACRRPRCARPATFSITCRADRGAVYGYQQPRRPPAGHHGHRSVVPDVSGLEAGSRRAAARRADAGPTWPFDRQEPRHDQQHVLQLLRHAGHAPLRRLPLAALELGDARVPDRDAIHQAGTRPAVGFSTDRTTAFMPAAGCTARPWRP